MIKKEVQEEEVSQESEYKERAKESGKEEEMINGVERQMEECRRQEAMERERKRRGAKQRRKPKGGGSWKGWK